MNWAYGVTTVPERLSSCLPGTLASLAAAGFDRPRLFVDGAPGELPACTDRLPLSVHEQPVRAYGNWTLAMHELLVRHPAADRYLLFQDDVRAVRNLRAYLDRCELSDEHYWNLITYPGSCEHFPDGRTVWRDALPEGARGWCRAPRKGKGAQGLAFTRRGLVELMSERGFVERVLNREPNGTGNAKGDVNIDGGVYDACERLGRAELVHAPSLLDHLHVPSAIGNRRQPPIPTFPGEDFDCLTLLS